MLDDYICDQKVAYKILKNCLDKKRISHAYLIETNGYINSFAIALSFAKALLCPNNYTNDSKCEGCFQCNRIDNNNYPELKIIEPDGLFIKKEQLNLLQKEFSTKSVESKYKIYIVKNAEKLNTSAANSILKFLEEPEENIIAILITDNIYEMLSTIVSRCQVIKLRNIKQENILSSIFKDTQIDLGERQKIVDNAINFIIKYEKNKINTLLYLQSFWHEYFKEKETILLGFEIMILFYREILDYKLKSKITNFLEYESDIVDISSGNSLEKIAKKIEVLLDLKDKIYYNINNQLLMDKLIIEWEK